MAICLHHKLCRIGNGESVPSDHPVTNIITILERRCALGVVPPVGIFCFFALEPFNNINSNKSRSRFCKNAFDITNLSLDIRGPGIFLNITVGKYDR